MAALRQGLPRAASLSSVRSSVIIQVGLKAADIAGPASMMLCKLPWGPSMEMVCSHLLLVKCGHNVKPCCALAPRCRMRWRLRCAQA